MSVFDWILFGISIIFFAAGAVFMAHQVFCGLEKTALNDKYVWGMNIQGFYFLSAAGIGILTVLAAAALILGPSMDQEPFRVPAAIAFGCLISAQLLMATDLGRPFRAMRIITGKNFISPLTLDFLVLLVLTILAFIFMFGIFTGVEAVFILWTWASLFLCIFGMIIHTLLFIPRVGAGYQSEPFQSAITLGSGIWAGSAVMLLAFSAGEYGGLFRTMLIIGTAFVFVSSAGSVLADLLAGNRPHELIFCGLSFIVTALLFANGFILAESELLLKITAVLVLVSVYFEKHQTVLHLQKRPVLPMPYSQFERKLFYRPVLAEWLSLVSGVAAVIAVTYAVIIIRTWILPWIIGLIG